MTTVAQSEKQLVDRLDEIGAKIQDVRDTTATIIFGQDRVIDLALITLLSGGHALLIGVPGLAKTSLVETLGAVLGLENKRIQFTPDLMPSDIVGSEVLEETTAGRRSFRFVNGPIFTQLLMADEINRASPKTQSALLQAMQEHHVTVAGTRHDVPRPFHVLATQNPLEQEGTYPLPEAQLDRFLFKHVLDYPSRDEERAIVARHGHRTVMPDLADFGLAAVADAAALAAARRTIASLRLSGEIIDYIVDIVRATRGHESLEFGASPRSANMIATASRAYAAMQGRDYVIPDDVKFIALPALRHRVVLAPGAEIEGLQADTVIHQILDQIPAPR